MMKILLPVDDSKFSRIAILRLIDQFRTKGTQVRVLHVIEQISGYVSADLFPHFVSQLAEIEEDRQKQAKKLVQNAARELREAGFKTSEVLETGDPKNQILVQAEKWCADLIVVGSHGLKGLDRFLMGSVSEAVTWHAKCSVEVVRLGGRPQASAKNVEVIAKT